MSALSRTASQFVLTPTYKSPRRKSKSLTKLHECRSMCEEDTQLHSRIFTRRGGVLHPFQGLSFPATNDQTDGVDAQLTPGAQSALSPLPTPNATKDHFYGSEGSRSERKKSKAAKSSPFLLFGHKKKSSIDALGDILSELKTSEFKDDRLISIRHTGWPEAIPCKENEAFQLSAKEKKRREAVWELFTRECIFLVDQLMVLKHCFMEPLKKAQVDNVLMKVEIDKLFGNLDHICHISYQFCLHFLDALKTMTIDDFGSAQVIVDGIERMITESQRDEIYKTYLLNYSDAISHLEHLETDDAFNQYQKFCEQDERCKRLKLRDFLISPMQHWLKIPLMLDNVCKYTQDRLEKQMLSATLGRLKEALSDIDKKMEWLITYERMREIQSQLVWPTQPDIDMKAALPESLRNSIVQSTTNDLLLRDHRRQLIHEGPICLLDRDRPMDMYAFLFTDFLLITKQRKDTKKKKMSIVQTDASPQGFYTVYKQPIPLDSLKTHMLSREEMASAGLRNSFIISQKNILNQIIAIFTIQTMNSAAQDEWLSKIAEAKEMYHESFEKFAVSGYTIQGNRKQFLKHLQYVPVEGTVGLTSPDADTVSPGRENHRNPFQSEAKTPKESSLRNQPRSLSHSLQDNDTVFL